MRQSSNSVEKTSLGQSKATVFRLEDLEVDNYHDGVLALDFSLHVISANKVAAEMIPGYWTVEFPCPLSDIMPAVSEEYEWLRRMVEDGLCLRNHVFDLTIRGKLRTLIADSYLLRDASGEKQGICLFLKDIGNLVALEQQIQNSVKLATVGKIAAGVAHEIRNPLTSIKGFLQMMQHELQENGLGKAYSYTHVMLDEIERVNELVSELLLLSKPRETRLEWLELDEIVMSLAPLIQSEAILHNIDFHLRLQAVPEIYADREMIKQVFLNLVKNAIESMAEDEGGKLVISSEYQAQNQLVRVDISDSGPGIPHYMIDRIFDAFFTTKETGTGLGLPICQRLVNDLGGQIKVTSKGFGTTFSVLLPVVEA